jgi:hypothetical protein
MSIYAGPDWSIGGRGNPGTVRTRDTVSDWTHGRRGSNTYPTDRSGVTAEIGISIIPDHCVPGHDDAWGEAWGDRCRFSIDRWHPDFKRPMQVADPGGCLILDVPAARALAAALTEWADGATVHPKEDR